MYACIFSLPSYVCSRFTCIIILQEKALHSDDYGKDLAGVEALQRKHKELEHDLTALEKKLEVKIYCFF